MEANKEKRQAYLKLITVIPAHKLVYLDESGIDMNICKDKAWGKKGRILVGKKSGKYYERTNIIAGYVNKKAIAPVIFNGTCNREFFEAWVEQSLIKELEPGQVVVMDNAAFHKSQKVQDLIKSADCKIIFLPPYSPDLNPIEKFWANMKRWIRHQISLFDNLFDALKAFFTLC